MLRSWPENESGKQNLSPKWREFVAFYANHIHREQVHKTVGDNLSNKKGYTSGNYYRNFNLKMIT